MSGSADDEVEEADCEDGDDSNIEEVELNPLVSDGVGSIDAKSCSEGKKDGLTASTEISC